jgi:vitamin B12 transporter
MAIVLTMNTDVHFATTIQLNYKPNQKWSYDLSLRKDVITDFKSPLVFAAGLQYQPARFYQLSFNGSRNFRVPTFNDLFWNPGGNLNLEPENSYQIDLGHKLTHNQISFGINTFFINTTDLIHWQPNLSGVWSPFNVANTKQYGLEVDLQADYRIKKHQILFKILYSYTIARDALKDEPLLYVPAHKLKHIIIL